MIDEDVLARAASARAAIETILYDIEDTIGDIKDRLLLEAHEGVAHLSATVAEPLGKLIEAATWPGPFDDGADQEEWAPVLRLMQSASDDLAEQRHAVDMVAASLIGQTSEMVTSLLPGTSEVFAGIVKVFGNLIDGLLGALSETSDFWTSAATILTEHINAHHEGISAGLTFIANAIIAKINEHNPDADILSERLLEIKRTNQFRESAPVDAYIAEIMSQPAIIKWLLDLASGIVAIHSILTARIAGQLSTIQQGSMADELPTPLSPSALVDMVRMKIVAEPFAKEHAKRSGLSNELFDLLRRADERLLDTQPILELWRRSGDDSVLDELYRLGYSQESVAALRTVALAVATPSDVVRFLVRDVYDAEAIARGRLDEDFEQKYDEEAFRAAGVTKKLAREYWMAHWQLPSPTQGYQMLHRGVLTMPELQALIKQADYAPGYVDKLIAISYNVPGRIDVRRMYETGIITTDEELESYYKMMGYSPEHAVILRDFTKRLKVIADESKADRKYGRLATSIVRAFVVGSLSEVQAKEALTQLGFSEERAALRLAEGEYSRQVERADNIRDSIGRRYVRGYLTEEAARGLLGGYGFDEAEVEYLFHGWQLDRELEGESDAERRQKDLSKSEIIAAYMDGLLSPSDTTAHLLALGYDSNESVLLVQLADAAEARKDAAAIQASTRTQYLRARIERAEAQSNLESLGLRPERIEALLQRWTIEREEAAPDISPAQLERMLMQGVIPIEQIEERLRRLRYTEGDINALLTLYGTDMSIAEEKLRAQQSQFEQREARLNRQGDRRLDLTESGQRQRGEQFNVQQEGLQRRFEQGISARADLQSERLDAQRSLQTERIAAQTERDAAALAASRERQSSTIQAQLERLQLQIAAADKRANDANVARQAALEQRERLAQQARDARDASQQRTLQAQADRQAAAIASAERRASEAAQQRQSLADQREVFTVELAQLRDELQQLRDIRVEAARVRDQGRAEQAAIRKETRAASRREISAADAAALDASMQALAFQRSAAIADVESRFAALQAQISENRQSLILRRRQEAERALAAATPALSLLDSSI